MTIPFERSFASHHRAKDWSERNELQPYLIYKSTKSVFWFKCDKCSHHFTSSLNNISKGQWCPYCSIPTKSLCDDTNCTMCHNNSLACCQILWCGASSINKCKENGCGCEERMIDGWDETNECSPRYIIKNSTKMYRLKCYRCYHIIEKSAHNINSGRGCAYCSNKLLCDRDDCTICYSKSFASHEKAIYWSDNNRDQPNGYDGIFISPRRIFLNDNTNYKFKCTCGHENIQNPAAINSGKWCKYCATNGYSLCTDQACIICYNKSYASHIGLCCGASTYDECHKNRCGCGVKKIDCWDISNKIKPRDVTLLSHSMITFKCNICPHTFSTRLAHDSWCPYCAKQKLCINECDWCYEHSFASSPMSIYWSSENKITPRDIYLSTSKKYKFICEKNHKFTTSLNSISNGSWCPYCVNKTEQKLYKHLSVLYTSIVQQYKVDWCQNKTHLPFDYYIPEYNIIIELDGPQHFKQIMNWKSPDDTRKTDLYKMQCANEHGISVIRLLQSDVLYDKYDWLNELHCKIREITEKNIIQNIFLCKNNEYMLYI
jgi:very-short-patch-repair endonuclease